MGAVASLGAAISPVLNGEIFYSSTPVSDDRVYPQTGKKMTVRVQCSHTGKSVDLVQHRGYFITSDWTTPLLNEALERTTGVYRDCQTLMFAGKMMDEHATVQRIMGFANHELPERVTLFMLVNRERFPQRLGPFRPVQAPFDDDDFSLPELTEEFRRRGFYWEMKSSTLESHGFRAKSSSISGQVSPAHPVQENSTQRELMGVPPDAQEFVFSYPVKDWENVESDPYTLSSWERQEKFHGNWMIKSFLSVGGFIYFDGSNSIVGVTTFGRAESEDPGGWQFADPQRWQPEWTAALVEHGRFQRITMRQPVDTGAKMFCWLRPNEVLESGDGEPLPTQPEVPHGGFVYLFHDNVLSLDESELALDRYFPVKSPQTRRASTSSKNEFFRPFLLVGSNELNTTAAEGGLLSVRGADQQDGRENSDDAESEDEDNAFSMTASMTPSKDCVSQAEPQSKWLDRRTKARLQVWPRHQK